MEVKPDRKRILLDPSMSTEIEDLYVGLDRNVSSLQMVKDGPNYIRLVAEPENWHYRRAVLCYIEGHPVGYLYNELAKYFQPQLLKLDNHGIDLMIRCKVYKEYSTVRFRSLGESDLKIWVDCQIAFERSKVAGDSPSDYHREIPDERIRKSAEWLCAQSWFLEEDVQYANRFGYGLLAYTAAGGALEGLVLSEDEKESLLTIAYALHRSPDEGIEYRNKVRVGSDGAGIPVHSPYIGIDSNRLLVSAVVTSSDHFRKILEFIVDGDRGDLTRYLRDLQRKRII